MMEWTDSKFRSRVQLALNLWLSLDSTGSYNAAPWTWTIEVPYDGGRRVESVTSGDCGDIQDREAAKVHAERCAREYFEDLARKLSAE